MKRTVEQINAEITIVQDSITCNEESIKSFQERIAENRATIQLRKQQLTKLQNERTVARQAAERSREDKARRQVRKLCKLYDIKVDTSETRATGNMWVDCPNWVVGEDPIEDGHYGHNWVDVLSIVEVYAKHHTFHPDFANRQFNVYMNHI